MHARWASTPSAVTSCGSPPLPKWFWPSRNESTATSPTRQSSPSCASSSTAPGGRWSELRLREHGVDVREAVEAREGAVVCDLLCGHEESTPRGPGERPTDA